MFGSQNQQPMFSHQNTKTQKAEEIDFFLKTVKARGFLAKAKPARLVEVAKYLEFDKLCLKIEKLMARYVEEESQQTFATFIINTLLQTMHELHLVESELLSIWASVLKFKENDTLINVLYDFLNDVLKGPTHLTFYVFCQRLISQVIYGDFKKGDMSANQSLNTQHIKIEHVSELVPKVFSSSTLLQIYEQVIKEK